MLKTLPLWLVVQYIIHPNYTPRGFLYLEELVLIDKGATPLLPV
jgi:hypothetical protein